MRVKPEPGAQPRSFLFTTTAGQALPHIGRQSRFK
jgi:hypothetical protein